MNLPVDTELYCDIFLRNGFIDIETFHHYHAINRNQNKQLVGTLLNNMASYGYTVSKDGLDVLCALSPIELQSFWATYEPLFKELTGSNRNMAKYVVYKNFPEEVLDMSQAEYWFNQIRMYIGIPNEYFTQPEKDRPQMLENLSLKVLHLATEDTKANIQKDLISSTSRWSDTQTKDATTLFDLSPFSLILNEFGFKENGVLLISRAIKTGFYDIDIEDATDILRLCVALSDGTDLSLRTNTKFKNFTRSERKNILRMLNSTKNILEDFTLRPEMWKRLLSRLHPGDFKQFNHVIKAYDALYNKKYQTFNSKVENDTDGNALALLSSRPGAFLRQFHAMYSRYGSEAVRAFMKVLTDLDNTQLLKLKGYVKTIDDRKTVIIPPKGNWSRAKIFENKKTKLGNNKSLILTKIDSILKSRMDKKFPTGVNIIGDLSKIKLQTNDQKLATYGRGTVFDIPENIKFIRSASYWQHSAKHGHDTWFDNGWNFFTENWGSHSTIAWNSTNITYDGAIFSGDPTNTKDLHGRGCQMIDLYVDKLLKAGIRYAVWNILCYNKIPFSDSDEVLATLQFGEKAESGELYEPSRAQMVFPLTGKSYTKYIAYIDLKERTLVYMDADLAGSVKSAVQNQQTLSTVMPAYLEYLDSLPSLQDLMETASSGDMPVAYNDSDINETEVDVAYTFQKTNADIKYNKLLTISELLE